MTPPPFFFYFFFLPIKLTAKRALLESLHLRNLPLQPPPLPTHRLHRTRPRKGNRKRKRSQTRAQSKLILLIYPHSLPCVSPLPRAPWCPRCGNPRSRLQLLRIRGGVEYRVYCAGGLEGYVAVVEYCTCGSRVSRE